MRTLLPLLLLSLFLCFAGCDKIEPKRTYGSPTGVLVVSTMDGHLTALDPRTGIRKWTYQEGPVLKSPVNIKQDFTFIPNPQDGQLYILGDGRLNKLPFTIPQLVKASPCRSSDGLLYAGSKKDVWMRVDPEMGVKAVEAPQPEGENSFCPLEPSSVFIGRTVYRLSMKDSKRPDRQWNATFMDYSAALLPDQSNYPFQHIHSSTDGRVLTLDAATGSILWREEFNSMIVNVYLLNADGMYKLRTQAVGAETFEAMLENSLAYPSPEWTYDPANANDVENMSTKSKELYPSLYVGETANGLYALPALVDDKTITIAPKYIGPPLLEGPTPIAVDNSEAPRNMPTKRPVVRVNSNQGSTYRTVDGEYLLLGYHEPPKVVQKDIMTTQIPDIMPQRVLLEYLDEKDDRHTQRRSGGQRCVGDRCYADYDYDERPRIPRGRQITDESNDDWTFEFILLQLWRNFPSVVVGVIVTLLVLLITAVWLCGRHSALLRYTELSRNGEVSHASRSSRGSARFSLFSNSSSVADYEDAEGMFAIGKIRYDSSTVLGKGCEGTVVYKGEHDCREAAIKRVLSHLLKVDREVKAYRENDWHENVIRYFGMEEDRHFRYIALELCDCTLHDYIQKEEVRTLYELADLEVLKQANEGVAYLHGRNIVHRDLKPQNILISSRGGRGRARIVISDFGLAKPIHGGHSTYASGLAGTDGWMAPEVLENQKVTAAVDVFSLGCIFYYVLSKGAHPFGQGPSRQEKITKGEADLTKLLAENASAVDATALELIQWMLKREGRRRPTAAAVKHHPVFWTKKQQLQFLCDVSNRLETDEKEKKEAGQKEAAKNTPERKSLEKDAKYHVLYGNWYYKLPQIIRDDLRERRTYNGDTVFDLIRAVRNKHNHYNSLPEEVRKEFGSVPDGFLDYFLSRFPKLLIHVYRAMSICGEESSLQGYYPDEILKHFRQQIDEPDSFYRPQRVFASPQRMPAAPPGFEPHPPAPEAELNESDVSNWRSPKPATNANKKKKNRAKPKKKDRFAALTVEGDDDEEEEAENRQPDESGDGPEEANDD